MSKFKKMMFRVKNPSHSAAIQLKLFDLGYVWADHSREIQNTTKPFLFTGSHLGEITFSTLNPYGDDPKNGGYNETTLEQLRWHKCEPEQATQEYLTQPLTSVKDFLEESLAVLAIRGKEYDKPEGERSMGRTVEAFNAITGHSLKEADGWLLLQILKDVRQWTAKGFHQDSALDCISYAALKAECLAKGKKDGA